MEVVEDKGVTKGDYLSNLSFLKLKLQAQDQPDRYAGNDKSYQEKCMQENSVIFVKHELYRNVSLECGRRCLSYENGDNILNAE